MTRRVQTLLGRQPPPPSEEASELVTGYVGIWLVLEEAHITAVAVRQCYQRRGIGELLMMGALELAVTQHCHTATLEVRVSNIPAQALYEKYGFRQTGLRKGYYNDNREDALIMSTQSLGSLEERQRLWELRRSYVERYGQPRQVIY